MIGRPRRYRPLGLEDQAEQRVVVQVLPDTGQVVDDIYPNLAEVADRPDTGQEQQLRRVDRPAADDHLGVGRSLLDAPAPLVFDTRAAPAVEGEAADERAGEHGQVRTALGRVQIRHGGALAPPVGHAQLVPARALLHPAVEVVGHRVAELLRRSQEHLRERVRVRGHLGPHRSAGTPVLRYFGSRPSAVSIFLK